MDSAQDVYTSVAHPFAPVYWGLILSLLLLGVTIMQAYTYFSQAKDHLFITLLAASMLILDVVDSGLVAYSVYFYLVPHFGSVSRLAVLPKELAVECLVAVVLTTLSQFFFVYQLVGAKRLGKGHWSIIGAVVTLALLSLAGGIACVVTMTLFGHSVLQNRNRMFEITFGLSKGLGSATDIVATIAMCLFLNSVRTGMNKTNSLINSLIQLLLNRGVIVTLAQTLLLITFYATPTTLTWMFFHINVPKLYVNTFFGMLNARDRLKTKHIGTSVKLDHIKSSRGKIPGFGSGEHSTLVADIQNSEKNASTIMMNTVVTTSVS